MAPFAAFATALTPSVMTLRSATNFPSSDTKKPWPLALRCPASLNTVTTTTALRACCATSAKFVVRFGAVDEVTVKVEVEDAAGAGKGSRARVEDVLRPQARLPARKRRIAKRPKPALMKLQAQRQCRREYKKIVDRMNRG